MARRIEEMVVVITGASAGIGRALARRLAARGARLALAARRINRLEQLNASLGGGHVCVRADVSNPHDCEALVARAVERFGRLDTLVCNAGYGFIRPVSDTSAEAMREVFQTNVFGTADCVRAAVPRMLAQEPLDGWRGQVVVVSSAVARRGLPWFGAYSATKAAQLSLAEAMRVELRPQQIAVTSVHPVGTDTEFFRTAIRVSGRRPPRRNAIEIAQTPEQVADAIVRSIERPRPEVWPARPYRWLMSLATLMPRATDRIVSRRRRSAAPEELQDGGECAGPPQT
jgi:short-subunit dehydrogenase